MRCFVWGLALVCLFIAPVRAEEKPNVEQLKKAYDDALVQLKSAQNSKNDLARENEKLGHQLEDLKKQLAASQAQVADLQREVAENDQKTFELRSICAAWREFLRIHPDLRLRWNLFLGEDALSLPREPEPLLDPSWPLFSDRT